MLHVHHPRLASRTAFTVIAPSSNYGDRIEAPVTFTSANGRFFAELSLSLVRSAGVGHRKRGARVGVFGVCGVGTGGGAGLIVGFLG